MNSGTTVRSNQFRPDGNESENHALAKAKLVSLCAEAKMMAELEYPVITNGKTYYCDVLVRFRIFGSEVVLDLEVEDHDHSKHDYDDAKNKAKELERYFIRTIWFKSKDILKSDLRFTMAEILYGMIDGNQTDPRFNI